jgi:hypothetical protein
MPALQVLVLSALRGIQGHGAQALHGVGKVGVGAAKPQQQARILQQQPRRRLALAGQRLAQQGVAGHAIHGERVNLRTVLREGDRLELLGPLLADPKDARRERAKAQAGRPRED